MNLCVLVGLLLPPATAAAQADWSAVCAPETLFAVVGRTLTVRHEQLGPRIPAMLGTLYECRCDSGETLDGVYAYAPGSCCCQTLTIVAADSLGAMLETASTQVRAVPATAGEGTKAVLFVGDSLVAACPSTAPDSAYIVTNVRAAFERDGGGAIRLLGTRGLAPSLHEGYSGRAWVDFTSPSSPRFTNPFWNPAAGALDFRHYLAASGQVGPIDYCVVHLGYNDLYALLGAPLTQELLDVLLARIDAFCAALLSPDRGYPGCRIVLILPSSGNGRLEAWLDDYGSADDWEAFETNVAIYREALCARYDGGAFHPQVGVCAAGLSVDRIAGYYPLNYLHPNRTGYAQLAEPIYAQLRGLRRAESELTAAPPAVAAGIVLEPSRPNPANPRLTVAFTLPRAARVRLAAYDLRGAPVATLVQASLPAGRHLAAWDGSGPGGRPAPSGVYLLRLEADGQAAARRVSLVR